MTAESLWPTVLAEMVANDERTHAEIVLGFEALAKSSGENATLSVRTLHRWMAGNVATRPRAGARRVARVYWGRPMEELLKAPHAEPTRPLIHNQHTTDPTPSSNSGRLEHYSSPDPPDHGGFPDSRVWYKPSEKLGRVAGGGESLTVVTAATARRELDRTLGSGTVVASRLDQIEECADAHRWSYVREAPLVMLSRLILDLADVRTLAEQRQPGMVQIRLSRITGELAVLVADTLMKLGLIAEARAWYRTARMAADDTPDVRLRVRVRAQESMLPYYYGDPAGTVRLTREAQHLAGGNHSSATALAAAAEARALARLGRADDARSALQTAQNVFEQIDAHGDDALLDFPEKRLLLYLSGTLTYLGRTREARDVQDKALALYTDTFLIDPALLLLDRAVCAALENEPDEACIIAANAVLGVPAGHRTEILRARAEDVIGHLTPDQRRGVAANQLREVLAGILPER